MSLLPVLASASSAIASRRAEHVRGIGDASSSRTLDGECGREDDPSRRAIACCAVLQPSRNGTDSGAPLWNGPRLKPAFVAQVLGQVMMDAQARALSLAPAAYRREPAQIRQGSFFDGDV
jgi:hypothetical protein